MSRARAPFFGRPEAFGRRAFAAIYLLAFLAAVTVAPHQHVNSLEDLLCDGPSDSGVFVEGSGPHDAAAGPHWSSARLVDDDPCLACFLHDSASEPIASLVVAPKFSPISLSPPLENATEPPAFTRSQPSRAPPASA